MFANQKKTVSILRRVLPIAILLTLGAGTTAADPKCKQIHSHLFIEADAIPPCGSPIGLCGVATVRGSLTATTEFIGTSFVTTDDTPTTGVAVVTAENTFHTSRGDFFTKDTIVLSTTGDGEFAEVDIVVGGTGDYTGATGTFTATGTFANGIGEGFIQGHICTP